MLRICSILAFLILVSATYKKSYAMGASCYTDWILNNVCSINTDFQCGCNDGGIIDGKHVCHELECYGVACTPPVEGGRNAKITRIVCNNPADSCCGADSCFLPGTQVSTPQGVKNIETIKPGDPVFSFNELTGKTVLNTVSDSPKRMVLEYYIIKTRSGREIKTTAEHPFYTGTTTDQPAPTFPLKLIDYIKGLVMD